MYNFALVEEANTVAAANPPKTPQKPRVSLVAEVNDLLTQVQWQMS